MTSLAGWLSAGAALVGTLFAQTSLLSGKYGLPLPPNLKRPSGAPEGNDPE
ncbi:hypothetical protein EV651_11263 [Kribbella sp. VKM Ac-2571]|nr:hypothetical protein EV651_11263 [Kribbella sp. VKM Ac-2571]